MSGDQVNFFARVGTGLILFLVTSLVGWLFLAVKTMEVETSNHATRIEYLERQNIVRWEKFDRYNENLHRLDKQVAVLEVRQ